MLRYERRLVAQQTLVNIEGRQCLEFLVMTSDHESYLPGRALRFTDLQELGKSGITVELKPLKV